MEARFGHDFSRVRVHFDAKAAASTEALNARAYTAGECVVFGAGQYAPGAAAGRRLLAHELAHVVQQRQSDGEASRPLLGHRDDAFEREARAGGPLDRSSTVVPLIQRDERVGPATVGVPADWSARVGAATTPAARASLIAEAVGLEVVDRTAECAGDERVNAAHLVEYTRARQRINYDDNLNAKRSPDDGRRLTRDAGYTLRSGNRFFIVLSRPALDPNDFFLPRTTVNHEFDHVRQFESGSTLNRNESELDAWTNSFVREFHRTYTILLRTSVCYVDRTLRFTPLLQYFGEADVGEAVRDETVRRIVAYYGSTIRPHPVHARVFRRWLYLGLRDATGGLPHRLNRELGLGVDPGEDQTENRRIDCALVRGATFAEPPAVTTPAAPTGGGRFGLAARGGAAIDPAQAQAAIALGARYSLRADRLIVVNPTIGAQLLYLPSTTNTAEHVAAAVGELGLRIQQPLTGFYGDVRAGGFVGLAVPPAAARPGEPAAEPRFEAGFSGAVGAGYRWERIELGAEARTLLGTGPNRFLVLGAVTFRL
jgi:hypothetical protein